MFSQLAGTGGRPGRSGTLRAVTAGGSAEEPGPGDVRSLRELAVARSLDSARTRAEGRVKRFMDAALELVDEGAGRNVTVQDVVARSGQSLRSFYQHFDGKHELMLALVEESVSSTAEHLAAEVAGEPGPAERLHRFVVGYHELCRGAPGRRGAMPAVTELAWQLLTEHPKEAVRAFAPLVALFRRLLDEAVAQGVARDGLRTDRTAGVVLEAIMFHAISSTIGGAAGQGDDRRTAEDLWALVFRGIGTDPAG